MSFVTTDTEVICAPEVMRQLPKSIMVMIFPVLDFAKSNTGERWVQYASYGKPLYG